MDEPRSGAVALEFFESSSFIAVVLRGLWAAGVPRSLRRFHFPDFLAELPLCRDAVLKIDLKKWHPLPLAVPLRYPASSKFTGLAATSSSKDARLHAISGHWMTVRAYHIMSKPSVCSFFVLA